VTALVGMPRDRVDGSAKVTGDARYSADIALEGMAHAVFATSTAAAGRITRIDVTEARECAGVVAVFTHERIRVSLAGRYSTFPMSERSSRFFRTTASFTPDSPLRWSSLRRESRLQRPPSGFGSTTLLRPLWQLWPKESREPSSADRRTGRRWPD
jgi:Aldehyde oxidase and xanthine dehydrogenase, a/b hammerhead domain